MREGKRSSYGVMFLALGISQSYDRHTISMCRLHTGGALRSEKVMELCYR